MVSYYPFILPSFSDPKVSTFAGLIIFVYKISIGQINIGISVSDSKSLCKIEQTLLLKLLQPFHSCCSFEWLLPFVFKDFLFKHSTVVKPLEQPLEFSVNEILQICQLITVKGLRTRSMLWLYGQPETRVSCLGLVTPQGWTTLITGPLFVPFIVTRPKIHCKLHLQGDPPTKKGARTKDILWPTRPTSSSNVSTRLCLKY